MPHVEINMWKGLDDEKKERLVVELTDTVMRVVGCPREAVHIIIREVPQENWATGGIRHSKKFAKEKPV